MSLDAVPASFVLSLSSMRWTSKCVPQKENDDHFICSVHRRFESDNRRIKATNIMECNFYRVAGKQHNENIIANSDRIRTNPTKPTKTSALVLQCHVGQLVSSLLWMLATTSM